MLVTTTYMQKFYLQILYKYKKRSACTKYNQTLHTLQLQKEVKSNPKHPAVKKYPVSKNTVLKKK